MLLRSALETLFHRRIGELVDPAANVANRKGDEAVLVIMRMGAGDEGAEAFSR
jgi:hypothetical protein